MVKKGVLKKETEGDDASCLGTTANDKYHQI